MARARYIYVIPEFNDLLREYNFTTEAVARAADISERQIYNALNGTSAEARAQTRDALVSGLISLGVPPLRAERLFARRRV